MEWFLFVAALAVLVSAVAVWLRSQGGPRGGGVGFPYTKASALFSPAERSFLGVLDQAVGNEYRIFGKVRVADIINVRSMADRKAWQRAFNKISSKHFDFVLCARDDLSVVAVVELDDKSHQKSRRGARDHFLAEVCEAVSLPMIQVPAKHAYSVEGLRMRLASLPEFSAAKQAEPAGQRQADRSLETEHQSPGAGGDDQEAAGAVSQHAESPPCPQCGARMVRREARSGANAGKAFWGCSLFPKCRGTAEIGV
ncbi:DUF2726 domain-containing protein [Halorhodospira halophila]|uniref:DUF2726 domain-containing protein n=1 Tax=Halorhodospira TaxID=85108 RepID=UPI0030842188|nr:hypothetical protein [Halorhodospira halophila]